MKKNIHFLQELATPHNNVLLKVLDDREDVNLFVYYAVRSHSQYSWSKDISSEIKEPLIYGYNKLNFTMFKRALNPKNRFVIVSFVPHTNKLLFLLFFLLRRKFAMWFDFPNDKKKRSFLRGFLRDAFYFLLKYSNATVFCVGKKTIEYFKDKGFKSNKLINLPIFIDTSLSKDDFVSRKNEIKEKFNLGDDTFFITTGSRLIKEKGFDLLIQAIAKLPEAVKANVKVLLVGKGEETDNLHALIRELKLDDNIIMEPWQDLDMFLASIANSDLYSHPSRFDAFGGTIYAMSLGIPVVGSYGAGAAFDRITHGVNGFLYDAEDIDVLTEHILFCYNNRGSKLESMGNKARETALKWTPAKGAEIVFENV